MLFYVHVLGFCVLFLKKHPSLAFSVLRDQCFHLRNVKAAVLADPPGFFLLSESVCRHVAAFIYTSSLTICGMSHSHVYCDANSAPSLTILGIAVIMKPLALKVIVVFENVADCV